MTKDVLTVRLRRSKAEVQAKAKPNVNAWLNHLIESALGPREPGWNEHFNRLSSGRRFRYRADEIRRTGRFSTLGRRRQAPARPLEAVAGRAGENEET